MSVFTLCVKDSFSAAHRLTDYHGKCEALHGHNFQVEAFVKGRQPENGGMVIDFTVLKGRLRQVLDVLDHKFINEIPFFRERAGSSEYIAMYVFHELRKLMTETTVSLAEVRVWESDTAWVAYGE
ncbi:6-pyruvoyl trahydropterin synthase family protein [Syntrophorhabdus aromaticivorans]|uniref:6-carboxy-5,6,7,8-tetrahydropterin synthase n=1 Tax=Syntrophorhabdus aromaticivorans TaxID=328301 RepID=A0A971RZW0_9BACT|nr:6-carboxytetrahydropterin synthase [Syntrophorhabdus aromaticivorans]NLW33949.1 6-carboxytetrahydropterin synthase [Syntrophorhabdus aromaticivorans]